MIFVEIRYKTSTRTKVEELRISNSSRVGF